MRRALVLACVVFVGLVLCVRCVWGLERSTTERTISSSVDKKAMTIDEYVISPSCRRIVFSVSIDSGILNLDGKEESCESTTCKTAVFSPNSERVAYFRRMSWGGYIAVIDGKEFAGSEFVGYSRIIFSRDSQYWAFSLFSHHYSGINCCGEVLGGEYSRTSTPFFSPDGKCIAYLARNQEGKWFLVLNNLEFPEQLFDEVHKQGIVFSEDSKKYVFVGKLNARWSVVTNGKKGKMCFTRILEDSMVFSPDGRKMAYAAAIRPKWCIVVEDKCGVMFDEVSKPVFMNDSRHVVYFARTGMKWQAIHGRKKHRRFDAVEPETLTFDSSGKTFAYAAKMDGRSCMVCAGRPGKSYDYVGPPRFNPENGQVAYVATIGEKSFVVLDGKEMKGYAEIRPESLVFSRDGARMAYIARSGSKCFVVVDGNEGKAYDEILSKNGGRVAFSGSDRIRYFAIKGKDLLLVEETIK